LRLWWTIGFQQDLTRFTGTGSTPVGNRWRRASTYINFDTGERNLTHRLLLLR
jgi:hypothetical protein